MNSRAGILVLLAVTAGTVFAADGSVAPLAEVIAWSAEGNTGTPPRRSARIQGAKRGPESTTPR